MSAPEVKPTYAELTAAANAALRARDALENPTSKEWMEAHKIAHAACVALSAERKRLAKVDRYGSWRTPTDKELMLKGYL